MSEYDKWWTEKSADAGPLPLDLLNSFRDAAIFRQRPLIAVVPPGVMVSFDAPYGVKCLECAHECKLMERVLCPIGAGVLLYIKERLLPLAKEGE